MSDVVKPKLFLHCKECNNGHLTVAVSEDNELLMICDKCNQLVAIIDKWPADEHLEADCGCDACKAEEAAEAQEKTQKNMMN